MNIPRRWTKSVLHWDRPCNGEEFLVTLASISVVEVSPGIFFPFDPPIFHRLSWWFQHRFMITLESNTSPTKALLKMIILFPRWDMLVPWRVLHFYHELIFIIPNFMQPKVNISNDMQLTLPFIKVQTTSRRKKYTVSFLWTPWRKHVSWDFMHWTWFLLFNGFVLFFCNVFWRKRCIYLGFPGGMTCCQSGFWGKEHVAKKVGGWIIQPQKRYWHFVRWLFMAVFLEEFDFFFPNGSVANWTWNDLSIISYAAIRALFVQWFIHIIPLWIGRREVSWAFCSSNHGSDRLSCPNVPLPWLLLKEEHSLYIARTKHFNGRSI